MCSDKAIDKTQLFSVNWLGLTRVELKFCMGRRWNGMYGMLTCTKVIPATLVIVMMW